MEGVNFKNAWQNSLYFGGGGWGSGKKNVILVECIERAAEYRSVGTTSWMGHCSKK